MSAHKLPQPVSDRLIKQDAELRRFRQQVADLTARLERLTTEYGLALAEAEACNLGHEGHIAGLTARLEAAERDVVRQQSVDHDVYVRLQNSAQAEIDRQRTRAETAEQQLAAERERHDLTEGLMQHDKETLSGQLQACERHCSNISVALKTAEQRAGRLVTAGDGLRVEYSLMCQAWHDGRWDERPQRDPCRFANTFTDCKHARCQARARLLKVWEEARGE
jgi:seryl-tRNA synthetase